MTLLQNKRKGDGVAGGLPTPLVLQVLRIEGAGAVGLERDVEARLGLLLALLQGPSSKSSDSCPHDRGIARQITTTRIAGGLLLGYNPNYTCPGLKSFALHFVQVTIAI